MKIIDCTTYFEEKMMMEVRFNILDRYVDKFIICEASFSHSGEKKEINFNINNYPEFKKKIIHIVIEKDPCSKNNNKEILSDRSKSILRIEKQRNYILNALGNFSNEDYIIHSDNDEIPNLDLIDFNKNKKKIILFKQKLFYYKFNLQYPNFFWFGSKACKLKNLKSFDWLRNIKNKKYNFFRLDTLFSKLKYNNIHIIEDGGWHFSNLKSIQGLVRKYYSDENHSEFSEKNITNEQIADYVERRVHPHNHFVDKKSEVKSQESQLIISEKDALPEYLQENYNKYSEWFA